VWVVGSGLPAPPEAGVDAPWTFPEDTPVFGACFLPTPRGSVFEVAGLASTQPMAVTVEPSTSPSAPILPDQVTA
jgi:hypothetical protein